MRHQLPPLHLLRTFEAAGRNLSFKRAAAELHVTASAVSHQIKDLERRLGFNLFHRKNRSLSVSEAGGAYLKAVAEGLGRIVSGHADVTRRFGRPVLKVSMAHLVETEIVVPHLQQFQRRWPDIELRIESTLRVVDFSTEDVDVAIRFGSGHWPGLVVEKLISLSATPLCAPKLQHARRIRTPADLQKHTLVNSVRVPDAWKLWGTAAGADLSAPKHVLWLDSYNAMLRAAEQGSGVVLGLLPLVSDWIRAKRLVAPLPLCIPLPDSFHIVYRPSDAERPELLAFRDWLKRQFAALE